MKGPAESRSGGDAVFRPAARWLRPPFPVTVRLTQGIMTPHPPPPKMTQGGVMTPLTPLHHLQQHP